MQVDAGAAGITVAKLGEAEVMADAGFDDLLVAYPIVGEAKLARLRALRERARVRVSPRLRRRRQRDRLDRARDRRPGRGPVEVDTGHHRMGAAARRDLRRSSRRRWRGVARPRGRRPAHPRGHAYRAAPGALPTVAAREADDLADTAEACARAGIQIREISVGSTPTRRRGGGCRRCHREPPRHVRLQRRAADAAGRRDRGRLRRTRPGDGRRAPLAGPLRDRCRLEDPLVGRGRRTAVPGTGRRRRPARPACWTSSREEHGVGHGWVGRRRASDRRPPPGDPAPRLQHASTSSTRRRGPERGRGARVRDRRRGGRCGDARPRRQGRADRPGAAAGSAGRRAALPRGGLPRVRRRPRGGGAQGGRARGASPSSERSTGLAGDVRAPRGRRGSRSAADETASLAASTCSLNNAGIASKRPSSTSTPRAGTASSTVNLRGMFLVAQAVGAADGARDGAGGAIVNMASTNALGGEADFAHYNASKGGVLQLTRTMAVELGPHGIRVNCALPRLHRHAAERRARDGRGESRAATRASASRSAAPAAPRRSPRRTRSWRPTRPPSSTARRS